MKKFTYLSLFLLSISCLNAQVDWNSYEEPDGKFQRLSIDPTFNFDTDYDGEFTDIDIDLSSGLNYSSRRVDTFSILNIVSNSLLDFGLSKQNDNNARRSFNFQPSFNINYDKYLTERRGLFLRGAINSRLGIDIRTNSTTQYNDFSTLTVGIGTGRIENISTVYQAIRINNQLSPENPIQQEAIFNLADVMRALDYNATLDSRMARIENRANFLNAMRGLNYSLENFTEISNAIDAFSFERPSFVGSGSRFVFELFSNLSFDNDLTSYSGRVTHSYHKPVNEKWHWSNRVSTSYNISNKFLNFLNTTNVNYFPSGRTRVTFTQNIAYFDGFESFFESSLNYRFAVDMNYFVSPTLSVFGTFSYDFNNIGKSDRYTNDLSNSIGFRKFLI